MTQIDAATAVRGSSAIGSADSHVIRYRADIDGLRAIAVWSVVAFHLSKTLAPNGYLGVDMFFVLSGYLITSIIWKEIASNSFRISTFYNRRIRRIMPALLTLLAIVTAVSSMMLLPTDLIDYGRSLLATLVFVANIYFWRDTDYFSHSAATKPLLHLWSLGVEEQFYVLFPLLLWILARISRRAAIPAIATLVATSLAADIMLRAAGGGSPAFYLLPTRGWELGVGALIAVLPASFGVRGLAAQALAAAGAVLTIAGILVPLSLGPMIPTSVPVTLGVALLIFSGRWDVPAPNILLSAGPLVFFGWISYSLYLWHWPIIVLGQYFLVRDFHPAEAAGAVVLMVTLATLSWWIVERPFRNRAMPISRVRWVAALGTLALAVACTALVTTHGLPGRLSGRAGIINAAVDTNYRCPVSDMLPFAASRACMMNLPSRDPGDADVILLGNSHAQMYAPLWKSILMEHRQTGLLVPLNGCLPTVTVNIPGCAGEASRNLLAVLALRRAKTIILGLTWTYAAAGLQDPQGRVLDNRDDKALAAGLDDLIARLQRAGKRVVLIGPISEPGYDIASDLSRTLAFGHALTRPVDAPVAQFRREFGPIIAHFAARRNIGFARVDEVQCAAGRCEYIIGGRSLFSDGNHIAAAALPLFKPTFEQAYQDATSAQRSSR
jgi:peptidoglycan/LPS O-acetylase OafA/YrhL